MSTNAEKMGEIGPVLAAIILGYVDFCPVVAQTPFVISGVTEPKFT